MRADPRDIHAFVVAIRAARAYRIPAHQHSFAELLVVSEGRNTITVAGHRHLAGPGDLVVFHPGREHAEQVARGPYHYVCLRIPAALLAEAPLPGPERLPVVTALGVDHPVARIARDMACEQADPDRWTPHLVRAQLVRFVAELWRHLERQDRGPDVAAMLDLVERRLQEAPTVAELADDLGLGARGFRAAFAAGTGMTPKRFLLRARLDRARHLLRETDRSVTAIAAELGFSSPQYLARQYRHTFGHPPSAERQR